MQAKFQHYADQFKRKIDSAIDKQVNQAMGNTNSGAVNLLLGFKIEFESKFSELKEKTGLK